MFHYTTSELTKLLQHVTQKNHHLKMVIRKFASLRTQSKFQKYCEMNIHVYILRFCSSTSSRIQNEKLKIKLKSMKIEENRFTVVKFTVN